MIDLTHTHTHTLPRYVLLALQANRVGKKSEHIPTHLPVFVLFSSIQRFMDVKQPAELLHRSKGSKYTQIYKGGEALPAEQLKTEIRWTFTVLSSFFAFKSQH